MPPKKKQEEVDLSTLPECKSINIFVMCKGKQERAKKILNKIDTKFNKIVFHVTRTQILDYAKQKGIYIDPTTLTQKQKKDAKFMDSICTELTPQVLAKATDAYITNQSIKLRLQKKAQLSKPQSQKSKAENINKIDCIYIFDDFPIQAVDFQALDTNNQGIKFIFVINPNITWVSAPEEPEPMQQGDQEGNEQVDQEYNRYKKMKDNEKLTPEELERQKSLQEKISNLKNARKKSTMGSQFRNTIIDYIKCVIDPYNEETNIEEASNFLIPRCEQLNQQKIQFDIWKKDKQSLKLPQQQHKQQNQKEPIQPKPKNETPADDNIIQTLKKLLSNFQIPKNRQHKDKQYINFDTYNFSTISQKQPKLPVLQSLRSREKIPSPTFLEHNVKTNTQQRNFIQQMLTGMKYPGINRFMIPSTPIKSQKLRKLYRATFGQFLPANMKFQEFQRKLNVLFLESIAKEADDERIYDFSNRIYEEQHTKQSLLRELNKALLFDESFLTLKYNENNDKLYICLLYKNPVRRMTKRVWQSNWKVLPNFQAWLKYFKDNQNNLNNTQYYDIDYQKIGNIEQQCNVFSIKDSGVIVRKKSKIAGNQNQMLYCLPGHNTGDLIFGLRKKQNQCEFYARNQIVNITVTEVKKIINKQIKEQSQNEQSNRSIFLTFKNQLVIQFQDNGDIIIRKPNTAPRLIKRDAYIMIQNFQNKKLILHPNGGISHPQSQYVNENGFGLENNALYQVSTLKRMSQEGYIITKRDDQTVIVQIKNTKWIKFPDSTEYFHNDGQIIIQKQDIPKFTFKTNKTIVINYNGVQVTTYKSQQSYQYLMNFTRIQQCNASSLKFTKDHIQIYDGKTQTPYLCQFNQPSISKFWEQQTIYVNFNKSKYKYNQKQVDPEEDQENFNDDEIIKNDYVPPRLFIINNDNTGIQLLSNMELEKGYLLNFNKNKERQLYDDSNLQRPQLHVVLHQQSSNKSFVYGVIPIPHPHHLNHKTIKQIPIKIDIFKNCKQIKQQTNTQSIFQFRSLIKYQSLTQQDRQIIAEIEKKRNQWQIKSDKQQNQFGYKTKNDLSTLDRYQSKKKIIELRKYKQQEIICQLMKNETIDHYNQQTQNRKKIIQNQRMEVEQQKRLSKKKSYVSQYQWKEPTALQIDQNKNYYNLQSHFYTHYFQTLQGKKALSEMPQWVFRPKQSKRKHQLDPQIREQLNATLNKTNNKQQSQFNKSNKKQSVPSQSEKNDKFNTVSIEPKQNNSHINIKPSVFTQRQIDEERFAFESQKKAYEYHERKRKDFDIYGRERKEKVEVPSLTRTQPTSQLNQKYLVTEAPVDKKIKISSMKNKLTSSASNMTQMRKQGPHANLIRTLDKANDYNKLLERRTMMVQADLNDQLQRDILITPIQANFGVVQEGSNYELKIDIKNEDVLAQRIKLKKPSSIFCRVQMTEMGPIALGMIRKVKVLLKAAPEIIGKFTDQFNIITKHQIYHIPITAQIVSKAQYESSGSVLLKQVRKFQQIGKKNREQLPPIGT